MATTTTGDTINANGHVGIIDFSGLSYVQGAYATYDTSTAVLAVYSDNYYSSVTVNNPGTTSFNAQPDGHGGTEAVPLCFASGTRIGTPGGGVAVERLRIGDRIITASGAVRPIRWIGHRAVACAEASPSWPVLIRAGAFGMDLPERDLLLSPGHPVLVGADVDGDGGHLVPMMCLINGTTVERVAVEAIIYWHVELDEHDILLAEGLPTESYHDGGSRSWFEGADDPLGVPDLIPPGSSTRCRPLAVDGPHVEAERHRLDAVFSAMLATQCAWSPDADLGARV